MIYAFEFPFDNLAIGYVKHSPISGCIIRKPYIGQGSPFALVCVQFPSIVVKSKGFTVNPPIFIDLQLSPKYGASIGIPINLKSFNDLE